MLLRNITTSNIESENEIKEKQTSVIVFTFISFFYQNYYIVCDMFEDRYKTGCLLTMPSNKKLFKATI